ncbi:MULTISPECIES: amidase family protein [Streptomyces]|uniref:amidase family protein n=1 Tax=Streptomyces TaxID=1883 RepID=UPI000A90093C|nr:MULTISPECIES: amidase family protein [Streptomyces]MDI5913285.1 amidase family protein [Streptomyces sp. 12257]
MRRSDARTDACREVRRLWSDCREVYLSRTEPTTRRSTTLKDSYETADLRSDRSQGSRARTGHPDAVRRLRSAGAVVIGKTDMPTGTRDVQPDNPVCGTWTDAGAPGS